MLLRFGKIYWRNMLKNTSKHNFRAFKVGKIQVEQFCKERFIN